MPPESGQRIEPVVREQPVPVARDQVDGLDVGAAEGVLVDEVVEVHPGPARLDAFATVQDLAFELM